MVDKMTPPQNENEICEKKRKLWSEKEILFLKDNYHKISVKEIIRKLKRNKNSIVIKAFRLGLSKDYKEENNPNWKGNKIVSYDGIHTWIKRRLKKPEFCPKCGVKPKRMDLCYKEVSKGRKDIYERDLSKWEYLCRKCHMESDGRLNNLKQFKENNNGR